MFFLEIFKILLLIFPFILIFKSQEKEKSFLNIFAVINLFILSVSLFLQYFNLFSFENVLYSILFLNLFFLFLFIKKNNQISKIEFKNIKIEKIYPVFIFIFIFIYLISPNLNFKGEYDSGIKESFLNNNIQVESVLKNSEEGIYYPYPFYSDEWVAFGFIRNILEDKKLPTDNFIVKGDSDFVNLLLPFYSFLSFFFSFFGLGISGYVFLGKFFNFLIIVSIYFILRKSGITTISASLASLSTIFITNGSNLTGLWHFIPLNLSILFLFLFILSNLYNLKTQHIFSILSVLIYVPIILFITPIYFYLFITKKIYFRLTKNFLFLLLILLPILILKYDLILSILSKGFDLIFRPSLYPGIELMKIWNVIPPILIPFSFFGLYLLFKSRNNILFISSSISLLFWFYYGIITAIFVMDKPRVVFLSALFLCIISAFSFDFFIKKIDNTKYKFIFLIVIILLALNIKNYTEDNNWKKISLKLDNGLKINSLPPLGVYFDQLDYEIFNQYDGKKFIASPWRSLVIASLTDNYPLETKPSYVGAGELRYDYFMNSSCLEKRKLAEKFNVNLVYGPKFECSNFKLIKNGSENLYLFEFFGKNI